MKVVYETYKVFRDICKYNDNVYMDFHISDYSNIDSSQIILNDDTLDDYRYIVRMNGISDKLRYGIYNYEYNRFTIYDEDRIKRINAENKYYSLGVSYNSNKGFHKDYRILQYKKFGNYLELYSWIGSTVWESIRIKIGHDTDILSVRQWDNGKTDFLLISIRARR